MNNFENSKYLKMLVYLIRDIGFPIVLSLLLLSVFFGWVSSPVTRTLAVLENHTKNASEENERRDATLRELIKAQRTTCVVQARTEQDRRLCIQ